MAQNDNLRQLNEIVQQFSPLWQRCKDDPANANHIYTLMGKILQSIELINNHLTNLTEK